MVGWKPAPPWPWCAHKTRGGSGLCSAEGEYIYGRKAEECSLGLGGGGDMAAMCFSDWREEPDGIITAVYEISRIRYSTKKEDLD